MAILRLKDLDASRETHPRTFRLHQIFRTERGAERFLAGRQFLVITIVFLIAQLTSFHDVLTFPLTDVTIPPLLKPVISDVFLGFGMAGALIAFWFAQLAQGWGVPERSPNAIRPCREASDLEMLPPLRLGRLHAGA